MGSFSSFDISASGISAQRARMDVIANNIANADTTRTPEGGPYKRQRISFCSIYEQTIGNRSVPAGVQVASVTQDATDYRMVYDPGHPDADGSGYVKSPNVNVVEEMVDMISATRAYEANVTAMNATKSMVAAGIEIGRG
ncbi:MAG: flagellar basal body rod protein FlgC [Armatimonadetes bacterium]|nr:flagellar basal body rod protein FlgC [Armatimonadota bacterium]